MDSKYSNIPIFPQQASDIVGYAGSSSYSDFQYACFDPVSFNSGMSAEYFNSVFESGYSPLYILYFNAPSFPVPARSPRAASFYVYLDNTDNRFHYFKYNGSSITTTVTESPIYPNGECSNDVGIYLPTLSSSGDPTQVMFMIMSFFIFLFIVFSAFRLFIYPFSRRIR